MKHIATSVITIITSILIFAACNNKTSIKETVQPPKAPTYSLNYAEGAKPANRLFPDKLRYMPTAIFAAHYPNPCYASFEDSMYIWKHNTTIQANQDLQIVEYGSFVYTEKGWYLRVTMTTSDFEKYYNCKGGLLKKGIVYTDNQSWRRDKSLTEGDAMWYYIAKDKNGNLVKGTAPIETEAKLVTSTTKNAVILNSSMSWTGYGEIGNYSLTGDIKIKNATIETNADTIKSAIVIIDLTTITHDDKNLEAHLKNEDFFEVAKYPTAVFVSESIIYESKINVLAKGKLTIKGITKSIAIPIKISSSSKANVLTGQIIIDRTKFGINYNSKSFFGNLGDKAIKNNFDLKFELNIN